MAAAAARAACARRPFRYLCAADYGACGLAVLLAMPPSVTGLPHLARGGGPRFPHSLGETLALALPIRAHDRLALPPSLCASI